MPNYPMILLAAIGRQASLAYAGSVVLGLALPQLANLLRPFIPISIFVFIMLAFARANIAGLRNVARQPRRLLFAVSVSAAIPPLIGWIFLTLPASAALDPGIRLGIALMAAAPPLMASPVYAGLLGFENSFALTTLVAGMAITPITAPVLASFLAGADVPISPLDLARRLALFIGSGILAGVFLRRLMGAPRLIALKNELDGLGVLMFFLFAVAAMDGVIEAALAAPLVIASMLALALLFSLIGFFAGYFSLRFFGFNDRFSVSICIGLRNLGLLIAPIIAIVPQRTFLYFAIAQLPIYFAPVFLKWLKSRLEPPANPHRPPPAPR